MKVLGKAGLKGKQKKRRECRTFLSNSEKQTDFQSCMSVSVSDFRERRDYGKEGMLPN